MLGKYFRDVDRGSNNEALLAAACSRARGMFSQAPRPSQIGDRESQTFILEAAHTGGQPSE